MKPRHLFLSSLITIWKSSPWITRWANMKVPGFIFPNQLGNIFETLIGGEIIPIMNPNSHSPSPCILHCLGQWCIPRCTNFQQIQRTFTYEVENVTHSSQHGILELLRALPLTVTHELVLCVPNIIRRLHKNTETIIKIGGTELWI